MATEARELRLETIGEARVPDLTDFLVRNGARITHTRESGHVDCYLPAEVIDYEEVPVEKEWVTDLARQMRDVAAIEGGTGQQSAINFGMITREPKLKIVDGFHRDAALRLNGERTIIGAVKHADWNGLYDQRIFDAKNHVHVRFSRVVQWIREVWQHSDLQEYMTVEQAILVYRFASSGARLGLTPDIVQASNAWVARKENLWGMAAMTIHGHLKIAENVDPRLVHSTTSKSSGHILEAPTQAILKVFSEELPSQFDFQNLVMDTAMRRNLKMPEILAVCLELKGSQDFSAAKDKLAAIDWSNLAPAYRETKLRALRRAHDPRFKGTKALSKSSLEISGVIDRTDQISERGEEITDEMMANLTAAKDRVDSLMSDLGRLSTDLGGLIEAGTHGAKKRAEDGTSEGPDDAVEAAGGMGNDDEPEATTDNVVPIRPSRAPKQRQRLLEPLLLPEDDEVDIDHDLDELESDPDAEAEEAFRLAGAKPISEAEYQKGIKGTPAAKKGAQSTGSGREIYSTLRELANKKSATTKTDVLPPAKLKELGEVIKGAKKREPEEVLLNNDAKIRVESILERGELTDYRSRVIIPLRYGIFPRAYKKSPVFIRRGHEALRLETIMEDLSAPGQGVTAETAAQLLGLSPEAVLRTEMEFLITAAKQAPELVALAKEVTRQWESQKSQKPAS